MNALALRSQPRLSPSLSLPAAAASRAASAVQPHPASRSQVQPGFERVDTRAQSRLGSLFAPVAPRAARAASEPAPTAPQTVRAGATPDLSIQDNSKVESSLQVGEELSLTGGSVAVDIPHTYRGDLRVTLTSPSGKSMVLHDRQGGGADDLKARFDLSAFAGESTRGEWKLTVEDLARADVGTLKEWNLELTGTPGTRPEEPTQPGEPVDDPFQGLRDEALKRALQASSSNKRVLSYDGARKAIFGDLDVVNGKVRDVYTHREIQGGRVPNSSDMNVEHTWPQSKGATGAAKSDLHHLFPTDSQANSRRSSFPFGEVVDVKWSHPSGAKLGKDAQGRTVFEPPDEHKGNVARAMFYFSATYSKAIPEAEEAVLKQWNKEDGVDAAELARNRRIAELQGNRNQFVENAALADRINDF